MINSIQRSLVNHKLLSKLVSKDNFAPANKITNASSSNEKKTCSLDDIFKLLDHIALQTIGFPNSGYGDPKENKENLIKVLAAPEFLEAVKKAGQEQKQEALQSFLNMFAICLELLRQHDSEYFRSIMSLESIQYFFEEPPRTLDIVPSEARRTLRRAAIAYLSLADDHPDKALAKEHLASEISRIDAKPLKKEVPQAEQTLINLLKADESLTDLLPEGARHFFQANADEELTMIFADDSDWEMGIVEDAIEDFKEDIGGQFIWD